MKKKWWSLIWGLMVVLGLLAACSTAPTEPTEMGWMDWPVPELADPDRFTIELFAVFDETIEGGIADDAFQMVFSHGEHGFPVGMFVSGGPGSEDRIFFIDENAEIRPFALGFHSSEGMVFARGQYGEGLLIAEPRENRIQRLLADGTVETFTELGTSPFGPMGIVYGPHDEFLYAADGLGHQILQVNPDGTSTAFARVPELDDVPEDVTLFIPAKDVIADPESYFGGVLLTSSFTFGPRQSGLDRVFAISADGEILNTVVEGLTGIELIEPAPGGIYGEGYYIATLGTYQPRPDGTVLRLSPDGDLEEVVTGINAVHVAFDTEGILGGGMFILEMDVSGELRRQQNLPADEGPSRIWRVTPVE
jgi:hypothetical protein